MYKLCIGPVPSVGKQRALRKEQEVGGKVVPSPGDKTPRGPCQPARWVRAPRMVDAQEAEAGLRRERSRLPDERACNLIPLCVVDSTPFSPFFPHLGGHPQLGPERLARLRYPHREPQTLAPFPKREKPLLNPPLMAPRLSCRMAAGLLPRRASPGAWGSPLG